MKNRKTRLTTCLILAFITSSLYGQSDKSQDLGMLLNNGEFFKSKELYQQISDTISPEIDLYYKFRMAQFLNKEDSATLYMEKIFTNYPDLFGHETINAYGILFDLYAVNLRNYEKGRHTYERMVQHLKENPYSIDEKELIQWKNGNKSRLRHLEQISGQPPIKLKRKRRGRSVKMHGEERLSFELKINGITRNTYWDTGCDFYYVMNRAEAETIGLKCDISEMDEGSINGAKVLTKQVILDSIEISNIVLYNIPATIFENNITSYLPDSVKNNPEKAAYVDSIYTSISTSSIGLPAMKLIGKILINYKSKKITFPASDIRPKSPIEPNIFLYDSDLYTRLEVNGKGFIGILDIGSDSYIKIDTAFYEKHENDIPTVIIKEREPYNIMMIHQAWNNVQYKTAYNPKIIFNNKRMQLSEKEIKIYSLRPIWYGEYFDGIIGYDFFKRIGKKVLLDLDNMRLEAIK